ncbi:MAG: hypothetical protein JXA22_05850 [Candidatus Thermoplasmatota archaeon]|nr:hypothetical protein [Candidatus Thermoplasmatota archaeon]
MKAHEDGQRPIKAKAYLIEPEELRVIWMNGSARRDCPDIDPDTIDGIPLDVAVPLARTMGVEHALRAVSDTGTSQNLHTSVITTRKGTLGLAASIYRLPDGKILMLIENAWQIKGRMTDRRSSL